MYLRARYYDSSTGRFINEDPACDGNNWYSYCAGNPVMYMDPSGMSFIGDAAEFVKGAFKNHYRRATTLFERPNLKNFLHLMSFGLTEANLERSAIMKRENSWFTTGDYLTMGAFSAINGSINPEEPLSFDHWMSSIATATMGFGVYKGVSSSIPKSTYAGVAEGAGSKSIYNANGDPNLRATRRPAFDGMRDSGVEVNGTNYKLNEHAYNSMFKSGRKDIMPADVSDALKVKPVPGYPGSVKHVNPVTGTKVFVNPSTKEIVGIQPSTFVD